MPPKQYDPEGQARRYSRSEEELRAAGGRRVNVRLQPKAAQRLDELVEKHQTDQTSIINQAILKMR